MLEAIWKMAGKTGALDSLLEAGLQNG